tara:strand:- start:585 stop:1007 length:423 start_codon:yes stop_codon:yes gene_type:complete
MIIAIASDHGGYIFKDQITNFLVRKEHTVKDFGTYSITSCDYPDYANVVCDAVEKKEVEYGILICGTGIGMSMAANRNPAIRAGLCKDTETALLTRQHNNANVLCLGARVTNPSLINNIVETFISTKFEGGRHEKRIKKF